MKLLKNGQVIEDPYRTLGDDQALPTEGTWMLPWARWRTEGEALACRTGLTLGLRVPGDAAAAEVADAAHRIGATAVAVAFPKFRDGRGFTLGRLLRERYGFTGELRAEGPLILDQYAFLYRCGFDAVAPEDESRLKDWNRYITEMGVVYQPAADRRPSILALRHGQTVTAQ